jgi:hypothetical protein
LFLGFKSNARSLLGEESLLETERQRDWQSRQQQQQKEERSLWAGRRYWVVFFFLFLGWKRKDLCFLFVTAGD